VSGKKKASSVHDGIFQEYFFCVDGTDFYSFPKLLQHASRETQKKLKSALSSICWMNHEVVHQSDRSGGVENQQQTHECATPICRNRKSSVLSSIFWMTHEVHQTEVEE
jgi:hypothetical protein